MLEALRIRQCCDPQCLTVYTIALPVTVASATATSVVAGEFANNNCAQLAGVTRPRQPANGSIVTGSVHFVSVDSAR